MRHESGTIEGVELYAFNNLPTEGDAVVPVRSFDAEALTKWIDNGVLTIPDTEFPQDAPVALVRVKYAHLSAQSSMVVRMLGYMNTHGAPAAGSANHTYQNSITTSAHFFRLRMLTGMESSAKALRRCSSVSWGLPPRLALSSRLTCGRLTGQLKAPTAAA